MERNYGLTQNELLNFKLQFLDFINYDFEQFETLYLEQLNLFNIYYSKIPVNYIDSIVYKYEKEKLFEDLFDAYIKIRLYAAYTNKMKNSFSFLKRQKMKMSEIVDELRASRTRRDYNDESVNSFAVELYNKNTKTGNWLTNIDEGSLIQVAKYLGWITKKAGKEGKHEKYKTMTIEEKQEYWGLQKQQTLQKLEENAKKKHEQYHCKN